MTEATIRALERIIKAQTEELAELRAEVQELRKFKASIVTATISTGGCY